METQDNDAPVDPLEVPESLIHNGSRNAPTPTEFAMLADLSPRQREVFQWICEGKRDREIALILGISYRTVTVHVRAILNKLGVENRTCAAMIGARLTRQDAEDGSGAGIIKNTYFYVCLTVSEMLVRGEFNYVSS
jgi:DNA-binding CsgD family transcriptional regulator